MSKLSFRPHLAQFSWMSDMGGWSEYAERSDLLPPLSSTPSIPMWYSKAPQPEQTKLMPDLRDLSSVSAICGLAIAYSHFGLIETVTGYINVLFMVHHCSSFYVVRVHDVRFWV
jgi:hypothetical protein